MNKLAQEQIHIIITLQGLAKYGKCGKIFSPYLAVGFHPVGQSLRYFFVWSLVRRYQAFVVCGG